MLDHADLAPGGTLAVACLAGGAAGLFDPFVNELLLALGIGTVLVCVIALIQLWRTSVPVNPPPDEAPRRIRIKEAGEAVDVWTKSLFRIAALVMVIGGSGSLGTLVHKLI